MSMQEFPADFDELRIKGITRDLKVTVFFYNDNGPLAQKNITLTELDHLLAHLISKEFDKRKNKD